MKIKDLYPGELRFCEDCGHRTIVNGQQNSEIRCKKLDICLKIGSEANRCILLGFFIGTNASLRIRKNFHVGSFDDILFE